MHMNMGDDTCRRCEFVWFFLLFISPSKYNAMRLPNTMNATNEDYK